MKSFLYYILLVLGLLQIETAQSQPLQAWRKRFDGAGLTVGINPLNPNSVYAQNVFGELSVSYDKGITWNVLGSPGMGGIRQIVVHPSDTMTIFCAASNPALMRSSDYGATWTAVLNDFGIDGESISLDPIHPDTMFAGNFADGNIFRSLDRGLTWTLMGRTGPILGGANLCALAIRPDSPNILYAGSGGGSISKTTNYGATWQYVKNGTSPGFFQETPRIVIDPVNPMIAYAATYGDVDTTLDLWKTTDGGEQWERTSLVKTPIWALEIDPVNPSNVYVGSFFSEAPAVYKTTDGGASFVSLSNGFVPDEYVWSIKIHPLDPSIIWAAVTNGYFGADGIFRLFSSNTFVEGFLIEGATSDTIANGVLNNPVTGDVVSIAAGERKFRFAYYEDDPSLTPTIHVEAYPFVPLNEPISFIQDSTVTHNITLTRLGTFTISGVLKDSVTLAPVQGSIRLFVTRSIGDTILIDSTDSNGEFQFASQYATSSPVNSYDGMFIEAVPPYATTSLTSFSLSTDLNFTVPLNHADVFLIDADSGKYTVYYQRALDALSYTTNVWDWVRRGPAPLSLTNKFNSKTMIFFSGDTSTVVTPQQLDSLQKSLDEGGNVFLTGQDIAEDNGTSNLFVNYFGVGFGGNTTIAFNRGTAGDILNGFDFFTTGSSANNQSSRDSLNILNPKAKPILDYGMNTGKIAAVRVDTTVPGGGKAVVMGFGFEGINTDSKRETLLQKIMNYFQGLTDAEDPEENTIPTTFALEQNYPNPFNPITVIRYSLPVTSTVSLKVYNLLGQEVAVLVDNTENAGFKSVEWKADNLPSGVYFYRLTATNVDGQRNIISETKKLVLAK